MKSTNKIEIMWFTKNYKDDWSNPQAEKYATKYLDNGELYEGMAHGNIYRFGFTTETDTYDAVILLPKYQWELLGLYAMMEKLEISGDKEFLEYHKDIENEHYDDFYMEVFGKLFSEGLVKDDILENDIKFNMVSPDVGLHFEDNKFTGYSS